MFSSPALNKLTIAFSGAALALALSLAPALSAQDHDRDRDRYRDRDRITTLQPGTNISVRTNDSIETQRMDNRIYGGIVDQDVRGDNGRLAIPRGSRVELMARSARDNDMILDLESVTVNGQRYAVRTEPNRVEAGRDNSVIGSIIGAINGGEARGREIRIPRDSVITFRLERPLDMGVADRGVDREGNHYHDYYRH